MAGMKTRFLGLILVLFAARIAFAEDFVPGQISDNVQCQKDGSQHYALYVPSNFTPTRKWPVIFGFDAGARGRTFVERYQAAAEKYGYILAGSNNSRNGPWNNILDAAAAMTSDVNSRFPLDLKRTYTAGMSGGARAAMLLGLDSETIAGVFASSAGFPDEFHESVRFPVFGSAGTDDFNHYEMDQLGRKLKSPHRIEVFVGTHEWLPVEIAMDGVEWMEIQAMKSHLRPPDQKIIDEIFKKRVARAEMQKTDFEKMRELKGIAEDFQPFKDVADIRKQAASLERQRAVKNAIAEEDASEQREARLTSELFNLRDELDSRSPKILADLTDRVHRLIASASSPEDSTNRRIARRVLSGFSASSRDVTNPEFRDLMTEIRRSVQPLRGR
jgi:predicted esterase/cytochrome c556